LTVLLKTLLNSLFWMTLHKVQNTPNLQDSKKGESKPLQFSQCLE